MKLISMLLVLALVGFLFVTNPTVDEFAAWYADQVVEQDDSALNGFFSQFNEYLAQAAEQQNCGVFSIFTYRDHYVLGIAMRFVPLDSLAETIADFRTDYTQWVQSTEG